MSSEPQLPDPQLSATPLIDVMLVLLIMLIITLPIATHAVKLNLPQGAAGPTPPAVRLEIMYRGELYWNGQFVASSDELASKLAALAGQKNPPMLQVRPEKRAPYQYVAEVLAAAQRLRVEKMSVLPVADL
jgi:biopolymer transport protein ExbD